MGSWHGEAIAKIEEERRQEEIHHEALSYVANLPPEKLIEELDSLDGVDLPGIVAAILPRMKESAEEEEWQEFADTVTAMTGETADDQVREVWRQRAVPTSSAFLEGVETEMAEERAKADAEEIKSGAALAKAKAKVKAARERWVQLTAEAEETKDQAEMCEACAEAEAGNAEEYRDEEHAAKLAEEAKKLRELAEVGEEAADAAWEKLEQALAELETEKRMEARRAKARQVLGPEAEGAQVTNVGEVNRAGELAEQRELLPQTQNADSKPKSRVNGKLWMTVQAKAEKIVKQKKGEFLGVRELCRQCGCTHTTLQRAIDLSTYLRARKAEYDQRRKAETPHHDELARLTAESNANNEAEPAPTKYPSARLRTPLGG